MVRTCTAQLGDQVGTCTVPLLGGDQVAMSGMLKLAPVNHPWLLS